MYYKSIHTYEDFRNRLPIQTYEEVKAVCENAGAEIGEQSGQSRINQKHQKE